MPEVPSDSGSDSDDHQRRETDSHRGPEGTGGGRTRDGATEGPADSLTNPSRGDDVDDDRRIGPEPSSARIEPGSPTLENALFVVLGAVAMVLVILRLVAIGFGG